MSEEGEKKRKEREIENEEANDLIVKKQKIEEKIDKDYFRGYSHVGIHEEMLNDKVRTLSYKNAMLYSKVDFKGKVVVDIGMGTGILSLFAVEAGASRVYGIEASEMADQAIEIIKKNNLQDKIIVIKGLVEEISLPEKADILISEWMENESMLDSIITAREKFLKPEGVMLPARTKLFVMPYRNDDVAYDIHDFWRKQYNFDFSSLTKYALRTTFQEADVKLINAEEQLALTPKCILDLDCKTVSVSDISHVFSSFHFPLIGGATYMGFAMWFDAIFETNNDKPIVLSTSPELTPTHWQQSLFQFEERVSVEQDDIINGEVTIDRLEDNKRGLKILIHFNVDRVKSSSILANNKNNENNGDNDNQIINNNEVNSEISKLFYFV